MYAFENKRVNGIHYSRFIASYCRSGGDTQDRDSFREWLEHLEFLNEDQILDILELATCGKLELEVNAKLYLKAIESKD